LFSGIGVAAVAEFGQGIEAFGWGHRGIIALVGLLGVFKAGEHADFFST
jgi:hypothetical protein